MFYHIQIKNKRTNEYKMDLSENNLILDIIQPYENGDPLTINGETFYSDDMKITIVKTSSISTSIQPPQNQQQNWITGKTIHKSFSKNEIVKYIFNNNENVTDNFDIKNLALLYLEI